MRSMDIDKLCLDILSNFPEGIIVLDEHLKCKYINNTAEKYLCIVGEEYIGWDIKDLKFGEVVKEACLKVLETGSPESCACHHHPSNIRDDNYICKFDISLINNYLLLKIAKNKGLPEEIIANIGLEAMQSILLAIDYPVFFKDKDFRYLAVNDAFSTFFKLSKDIIIGSRLDEVWHIIPKYKDTYNKILSGQKGILVGKIDKFTLEFEIKLSDGKLKRMYMIMFPVKCNNLINCIGGIILSISELPEKNNELKLLSEAINHLSEGVLITNSYGVIQYINPIYEKLTGYTLDELSGKTPEILRSGKHSDTFYIDLWEKIKNKNIWEGVFINKKKDGTLYKEKASIFPVLNKDSQITNYVSIKRDITHEEELEEQLRQSQKMESIGRLAGGIAHDFNNIITVVLGYTELLLSQTDKSQNIYRPLVEIKKSSKRAASLTKHLLAFSRKQVFQMKRVDINKIISNMIKMLERLIGENIILNFNFQNESLPILSNVSMIEQIMMNLVINARDALQGRKKANISIETSLKLIDEVIKDGDFEAKPGRYALIKIKDNGIGMSEEVRRLIFEPFFTTKQPSSGTGLGLSTVYGIVKQHNGFMQIDSELGKGTTFNIYMPYGNADEKEQSLTKTSGILEQGGGVILILEDDQALLELLASALVHAGYSVISASSSSEVYAKLPESGVNLLLADIMLKGERGDEFAFKFLETHQNIKILFMSGYADKLNVSRDFLNMPNCEFIQKPFTIAQITRTIKNMLNE